MFYYIFCAAGVYCLSFDEIPVIKIITECILVLKFYCWKTLEKTVDAVIMQQRHCR